MEEEFAQIKSYFVETKQMTGIQNMKLTVDTISDIITSKASIFHISCHGSVTNNENDIRIESILAYEDILKASVLDSKL